MRAYVKPEISFEDEVDTDLAGFLAADSEAEERAYSLDGEEVLPDGGAE